MKTFAVGFSIVEKHVRLCGERDGCRRMYLISARRLTPIWQSMACPFCVLLSHCESRGERLEFGVSDF